MEQEQTCRLRRLNICDGHRVDCPLAAPSPCFCVSEELAGEVGWSGAARSAARDRDDLVARVELSRFRRVFRFS